MKSLYESIFDQEAGLDNVVPLSPKVKQVTDILGISWKIEKSQFIITGFKEGNIFNQHRYRQLNSTRMYTLFHPELFDALYESGITTVVNATDIAVEIYFTKIADTLDNFKIISERGDILLTKISQDVNNLTIEAPAIMVHNYMRIKFNRCTFKAQLLILYYDASGSGNPKFTANCIFDVPKLHYYEPRTKTGKPIMIVRAVEDGFKLIDFYKDFRIPIKLLKNIDTVNYVSDWISLGRQAGWFVAVSKKKLGEDYVKLYSDNLPWSWIEAKVPSKV